MKTGNAKRAEAIDKASFLLRKELRALESKEQLLPEVETIDSPKSGIASELYLAGLKFSPAMIYIFAIVAAVVLAVVSSKVLNLYFVPVFAVAGAYLPFGYIALRKDKRAAAFAEDYPTILMATASSMKVGMTPYIALERSVRLLPKESLVRKEVETLSSSLRSGENVKAALSRFGDSVALPDLALFRSAFLLVLENGGRFSPTLARLANVSRDRDSLISSARVSTATMRMTANILLAAAPLILFMVSLRTKEFWDLFLHHPTANMLASTGLVMICGSYAILRKMSNFKP